jgi:hypothetical protein
MATYHADIAGSNTAPYDTWAKAATSLQTVVDLATVTDDIKAQGTFNESIDVNTNSGSAAGGYIKIIGYNGSEVLDGTRCVIDGESTRANCLTNYDQDIIWWENFEFTGATESGVDLTGTGINNLFINCISHNNGIHGWDCVGSGANRWMRCLSYGNTNVGWNDPENGCHFFMCFGYQNGDEGVNFVHSSATVIASGFFDNGESNINLREPGNNSFVYNCFMDGTNQTGETGALYNRDWATFIANRITNCATGLDCGGEVVLFGLNLFHNNTADTANVGISDTLPFDTVVDSNEYDPDIDDGYNAAGSFDYNLKADRTYNGDGSDTIGMNVGS